MSEQLSTQISETKPQHVAGQWLYKAKCGVVLGPFIDCNTSNCAGAEHDNVCIDCLRTHISASAPVAIPAAPKVEVGQVWERVSDGFHTTRDAGSRFTVTEVDGTMANWRETDGSRNGVSVDILANPTKYRLAVSAPLSAPKAIEAAKPVAVVDPFAVLGVSPSRFSACDHKMCNMDAPAKQCLYEANKSVAVVTAKPKCGNNECETPYQNVAQRYCQGVDRDGQKTGATLEWSCEPCHLLDEADWASKMMFEVTGNSYKGPERLPRSRLSHVAGMSDDDLVGP